MGIQTDVHSAARDISLAGAFKKYAFIMSLSPPIVLWLSYWVGQSSHQANGFAWLPFAFLMFGLPLLDLLLGEDRETGSHQWSGYSFLYDAVIYLSVPIQFISVIAAAQVFDQFSTLGKIGWVLSTGMVTSITAVNIAHELMHRPTKLPRFLGGLLYCSAFYPGVKIRHARQHHPNVGTLADAGTAPYNQTVYGFIARVYLTSIPDAWKLAARRKKAAGAKLWWLRNEMMGWLTLCGIFVAAAWLFLGWSGVLFFLTQGLTASIILESVNYPTHYGLLRRHLENGKLEPPSRMHAWDYNSFLTNAVLINAQRHGDHHQHPAVFYQSLEYHDDNPRLPACYLAMALVAYLPPLWKKLMHPRLHDFYRKQGVDYEKLCEQARADLG